MTTYQVFQIDIAPYVDEFNDLGWGPACEKYPQLKAYLDTTVGGFREDDTWINAVKDAWAKGFYKLVFEIEADFLEDVFHIGNVGPEDKIKRIAPGHSVSVGDVIKAPDGKVSVVASFGFEEVQ